MGYYKKAALTDSSLVNIDGKMYYSTGDIVEIDWEGYIKIIGRCGDSFPLSCGYNIQPQFIENLLCENELVNDAVIFGEGKEFVSALIVPNLSLLKTILQKNGHLHLMSLDEKGLLSSREVQTIFHELIRSLDKKVAEAEMIQKYVLLAEPFSEAKGEINENGKKKRSVIYKNYERLI